MPQELQVLQCYSCETFQVHIVKKSTNKWQCKMCSEKQSVKQVYGRGSGKDCRVHVQKLNDLRRQKAEYTSFSTENMERCPESEQVCKETPVKACGGDILSVQGKVEPLNSKWSKFISNTSSTEPSETVTSPSKTSLQEINAGQNFRHLPFGIISSNNCTNTKLNKFLHTETVTTPQNEAGKQNCSKYPRSPVPSNCGKTSGSLNLLSDIKERSLSSNTEQDALPEQNVSTQKGSMNKRTWSNSFGQDLHRGSFLGSASSQCGSKAVPESGDTPDCARYDFLTGSINVRKDTKRSCRFPGEIKLPLNDASNKKMCSVLKQGKTVLDFDDTEFDEMLKF
ncbi:uncharacterized protein LOC134535206 [Bacillus rossius redtenbacheri]|uniref:uncharacterized protein LOC134535206 n=1 Tax=Bacillus rossius redtenbacheri TaxID=93214 RepID=UPI002FDC7FBC